MRVMHFLLAALLATSSLCAQTLDSDFDSLPDAWEISNGRDPFRADYAMDAGVNNSCAIDENGVSCWGMPSYGQTAPQILSKPFAVSSGVYHSCAIDDAGLHCWGAGTTNSGGVHAGQSIVPVLNNPQMVSAGFLHTCAVDDDGAQCWGSDFAGATDVPALSNPTMISAGRFHTCALDDDGVHCWGIGGTGSGSNSDYGQAIVPPLVNPTMVDVGEYISCALDDTGVVCWGLADFATVPDLSNPVYVSAGWGYACAVDDTGIVCWGDNYYGPSDVPLLNAPVAVSAGSSHVCALARTGVACWANLNANHYDKATVPALSYDPDGDGADNASDICTLVSNTSQRDTDVDGFGDLCDGDLDQNCAVNSIDEGLFRRAFRNADLRADFNGDGVVNAADMRIMKRRFGQLPGPSGVSVCLQ